MNASHVEPLLKFLKAQRLLVDYVQVAAFTILFYDYSLMLDLEITMIWIQKWTYTTILFILTRYTPFGYAYFVISNHMSLGMNPQKCFIGYSAASWLILVGITFAEVILSIRTWAVWRCSFRVGLLLIALHCVNLTVSCIFLWRYMNSFIYGLSPYRGFRGCLVTLSSGTESGTFIMLAVAETIVFFLMATAAVRAYRLGLTNEFLNVVHRDAVQFYALLMLLAVANIALILGAPPQYQNLFPALQGVLHSVFTSRIIINLRIVVKRPLNDVPTELHTRNLDGTWPLDLVFRPNEHQEEVSSSSVPAIS